MHHYEQVDDRIISLTSRLDTVVSLCTPFNPKSIWCIQNFTGEKIHTIVCCAALGCPNPKESFHWSFQTCARHLVKKIDCRLILALAI